LHITYPSALAVVHFQPLLCFADASSPGVVGGLSMRQHLVRAGGAAVGAGRRFGGLSWTTTRVTRLGSLTAVIRRL
jgi:hypothetical protein